MVDSAKKFCGFEPRSICWNTSRPRTACRRHSTGQSSCPNTSITWRREEGLSVQNRSRIPDLRQKQIQLQFLSTRTEPLTRSWFGPEVASIIAKTAAQTFPELWLSSFTRDQYYKNFFAVTSLNLLLVRGRVGDPSTATRAWMGTLKNFCCLNCDTNLLL